MRRILNRFLILAIAIISVVSCNVLQPPATVPAKVSKPNPYAIAANLELEDLESSDVLVRLDNSLLAAEMQNRLRQLSSEFSEFQLWGTSVQFEQQFIRLTTQLLFRDSDGSQIKGQATGYVTLEVSGANIEWFPSFNNFKMLPADIALAENAATSRKTQTNHQLLDRLNSGLNRNLSSSNFNQIILNPIPLGNITTGARLNTFDNTTGIHSAPLNGVFFVTGSAKLIDKTHTSLMLDLSFVPDLAVCPADVEVSRAVFSRTIEAREPVDIANNLDDAGDMRVFYSEISGATRPVTIIHYWFADGTPVAVEELPVGPSERWRTWSTRGDTTATATQWRVLVVEKESGCILHSQSIRPLPVKLTGSNVQQTAEQADHGESELIDDFAVYQAAFNENAADFPAWSSDQGQVSINIRREYLGQVFQAAISDLQIEAVFQQMEVQAKRYGADLLPFETGDIACQEQKCANPLVCTANISQCKRLRDTRECSSCLFHNPLNNRCLQMAEDPICEAAKNRLNVIYQQDHEACIAAAQSNRDDCLQLSEQIAQSCEIENRVEQSACEASKAEITSLKTGSVLARVSAGSNVSGQISTLFSNFKISSDLTQIQQNVTLKSELNINGQLVIEPENTDWLLSDCMSAWSGTFKNRANSSTPLNPMLTTLNSNAAEFTANWSGIVLPIKMNSSPLESIFVSNPQLLAGCSIGLTVDKVEQAVVGENSDFFTGSLNLEVQPLPTRLRMNHAVIELADQSYKGAAEISEEFVSYDLK